MKEINFNEIKEGIQESVKDLEFICPKCKSDKIKLFMQALCIEDGKFIDRYGYNCLDCGENFNLKSKPLKHFEDIKI